MSFCINPGCKHPQNPDKLLFCKTCGSDLLLSGRYRVSQSLSKKGGFSHTYEITQGNLPKVLKILNHESAEALELFRREAQALQQLNHPGIPKGESSFDFFPRDSQTPLHCLVMEKIEGLDLEEYMNQRGNRPIDQESALEWLSQLATILKEVHSRYLFHRDIKPSNIMLNPDGHLVLIDFGAVRQVTRSVLAGTPATTRVFTPGYAAPEQENGRATPQSDFFSLGRTFVYLLTGKDVRDPELYNSQTNELQWRSHASHCSSEIMDFIDQLMAKSVTQRPANPDAILQWTLAIRQPAYSPTPNVTLSPQTGISQTQPNSHQINTLATSPVLPKQSTPTNPTQLPTSTPYKKTLYSFILFCVLSAIGGATATFLIGTLISGFPKDTIPLNVGGNLPQKSTKEFNQVKDVPQGEFSFGGSTTWATTRQSNSSIDTAIQGVFPNFQLKYIDPTSKDSDGNPVVKSVRDGNCEAKTGSNTGICMLLYGDLTFAQSSVSLDKSNHAEEARNRLKNIEVAWDAITIVVHPTLKINGLTIDQVRDIYTGKITNWNQIDRRNGDLPIVPYSRPLKVGGTVSSFKDLVFKKADSFIEKSQGGVIVIVDSPQAGLQELASNPGGIFYGSAKEMIVDFCSAMPVLIGKNPDNLIPPYKGSLRFGKDCERQRNEINSEVIKTSDENIKYPLSRKIYVIVKLTNQDGTSDPEAQKAGEKYAELLKTDQGQKWLEKAGFVSLF